MSDESPIIGIDLGTTNSVAAWFRAGELRFLENALGQALTPSAVAVDPRTRSLVVGRTAKDILAGSPHLGAAAFKRSIGSDRQYAVGERRLGAVDLSAYVLDEIRGDAERALGGPVTRCVVTVPAYFNDAQRSATKQAAETAGFRVERVLNEPTAAAIAYGLDRREESCTFLVFDLGGGTFDVCVMELFEGMLAVKSVAGDSQLGGEDFTGRLAELGCERAGVSAARMREEDPPAWALLYRRAELVKRQLSSWPAGELTVPPTAGQIATATEVQVTAVEAEAAFATLVDRLLGPCRTALRGANLTPAELSEVILVGGATRMPCVRRFALQTLGREPLASIDPDLVVAQGAAIQAALCAEDAAVSDIVVTDVASHSLGVDTARRIATRQVGGFFSPIIHRNTVIPTSRTELFDPVREGQTEIVFGVYEGDSRRVEENTRIGELRVKGLPPERPTVAVTFTYDLNGILEVEVKVVATGKTVSEVFRRDGTRPSAAELDRAAARIRQLKADPRQRPRFRDLLARADLLWKDVADHRREMLSSAIDQLEAAMATRTPQAMDEAYRSLLAVCERIDGGERW
ncbi:MAG TPA: Hsp70 family protein [Kofleriaceae bacterium]|nr:Hsp70 family protein [Kofleriaceae bacterium]